MIFEPHREKTGLLPMSDVFYVFSENVIQFMKGGRWYFDVAY